MALSGIGLLWLFRYGYGYSFGGNGNYGNYGMAVEAVTVKLKCCSPKAFGPGALMPVPFALALVSTF